MQPRAGDAVFAHVGPFWNKGCAGPVGQEGLRRAVAASAALPVTTLLTRAD
jgi:hypothetical protein